MRKCIDCIFLCFIKGVIDRSRKMCIYMNDLAMEDINSIIAELQKGSHTALDHIIDHYTSKLYYFVLSILRNRADAEEVVQDTFIKVVKNIEKYDLSQRFSAWVFTIASNTAKDYLRKRKRHSVCISFDQNVNEESDEKSIDIPDKRKIPVNEAYKNEVEKILQQEISNLPDNYKEIILLRHIDDLSYDEIAEILDCKVGTVKSRLARAREMLKENVFRRGIPV